MSVTKEDMLSLITERAKGRIKGSVRLDMTDLAVIYVDETGAVESDQEADITLMAKAKVFHDIATGEQNPATAFLMRKLTVDGNPMRALKIGEVLSASE